MPKANEKAKNLFKKTSTKNQQFKESFEIQSQGSNPIETFFGSHKLSKSEEEAIQSLVNDQYKIEGVEQSQIEEDVHTLFELSSQIRAITKQSLILHGERIARGQEILKKYKRGAFTAWLELTYGNRRTPYNFLSYYLLYKDLPSTIKQLYQKIPYRAAYLLGSREGNIEDKIDIIEQNFQKSQKDLLVLIENKFPLSHIDRRVKADTTLKLVEEALNNLETIKARKGTWDSQVIKKLKRMKVVIDEILTEA